MALVSQKMLFDTMETQDLPYWKVRDREGTIAENDDQGDVNQSMETLKDALAEIEDQFVWVKICNATKAAIGKGGNKHTWYEYKVNLQSGNKQGEATVNSGALNSQVLKLIEEKNELQRKIDRLEDAKKYDELQRQLDDLKGGDVWDKLLSSPAVMKGINGFFSNGQPVSVAGTGDEPIKPKTTSEERQSKIKTAIIRLSKVDENIDEHLLLLADFAEKNKTEYFQSIQYMKTL